jgi:hypothetical protein
MLSLIDEMGTGVNPWLGDESTVNINNADIIFVVTTVVVILELVLVVERIEIIRRSSMQCPAVSIATIMIRE